MTRAEAVVIFMELFIDANFFSVYIPEVEMLQLNHIKGNRVHLRSF